MDVPADQEGAVQQAWWFQTDVDHPNPHDTEVGARTNDVVAR